MRRSLTLAYARSEPPLPALILPFHLRLPSNLFLNSQYVVCLQSSDNISNNQQSELQTKNWQTEDRIGSSSQNTTPQPLQPSSQPRHSYHHHSKAHYKRSYMPSLSLSYLTSIPNKTRFLPSNTLLPFSA